MDAVVTAGGRISGKFARRTGVTVKALIEVGGQPVIRTVVDALRGLPDIQKIFVVGPEELMRSAIGDSADEIIPEAPDGAANFIMGLERCQTEDGGRAIFAASDLPFLTTDSLRAYLALCSPEADFSYPILRKQQFLAAYPGGGALFVPMRGGWYTGGCVFLLNPQALLANREMIERVFASRKSPFKLASILGWSFVFRLLTFSADPDSCARRGSAVIGCECRAVSDSPPELAYDLDDLADYDYAVRRVELTNA